MTLACAIDIGSNSFRLLAAAVEAGRIRPLIRELATVRLGEGLEKTGRLSPAAMARAEATLSGFAGRIKEFSPASLRVCATHAVRRAGNRDEFLARISAVTGFTIEVISGEEEAALAMAGVFSALPSKERGYPFLHADVGGGSSEIIRQEKAGRPAEAISLPIGAAGLNEESGDDQAAIRRRVRDVLAGAGAMLDKRPGLILSASGGTATGLAALDLGLIAYDSGLVQGHILTAAKMAGLIERLAGLSPAGREALPGMDQGRGRIILVGAVILQELQARMAGRPLLVSDAGLLEGILLSGVSRPGSYFPLPESGH